MRVVNKNAIAFLLIVATYVVSGKGALMLALPPGYASAIFPPAGIAVAAVFILRGKALPWILLGSFLLNMWVGYSASQQVSLIGLAAALMIAVASMLQAAAGGWVFRRAIGYPAAFDNVRDIFRFLWLAPVICLTSATLSAAGLWALGIFDAASLASNWVTWWVGDSLGVIVLLPIVMVIAGEPRELWRSRMNTVAIPMVLILALIIAMFLKSNQWEQDDELMEFRQTSLQSLSQIQTRLEEQATVITDMHGLFVHDIRKNISREEFRRFTQGTLNHFPMIQALEWAPLIAPSQRAGFEASQRKEIPGFEIRERDANGRLHRAGNRDRYYPVTYLEPMAGNEQALGFDLYSSPQRQEALVKAIATGEPVATSPIRLVQTDNQVGMLIVRSVRIDGRDAGVTLTVLKVRDFINKTLPSASNELNIRLIDEDGQSVMYDSFAAGSSRPLFESTFEFGSRHYRFQTTPTAAYLQRHRGWQSWGVLAMGTFGTGLLGALLLLGTGYTARVVAAVDERTRELQESEARFRNMADSSPVFIWITDSNNVVVWFNRTLLTFRGRSLAQELAGGFIEGIHPEDIPCLERFAQYTRTHQPFQMEFRLKRHDGEYRWILDSGMPRFDADGNFVGYIGSGMDITARKQAEQERDRLMFDVKQNAVEIEAILASQDDVVLLYDPEMNVRRANPSFMSNYGFDPLGLNVGDIIQRVSCRYLDGQPLVLSEQPTPRALHGEKVKSVVYYVTRADGTTGIVETSSRPMLVGGEIVGTVTVWHDITDLKHAEEELGRSAAEIEDLYNHAPCGYHSLDKEGVFVRINETELAWLGYARDEVIGKLKWQDVITPASLQTFRENFPQFMKQGHIHDLEFEIIRKDGSTFLGLVNASAIFDANGNYLMSRSTVFDITERKKAEEALKLASMVYENSSEAILVTDALNRIVAVNPAFERTTGYSLDEVSGKNPRIFKSGRHGVDFYRAMWQALKTEGHWHGEVWDKRKDGDEHAKLLTINVIKDDKGEVFRHVALFSDITERKAFEELVWRQANFDPLTKLPNRRMFHDRLEQEAKKAHRTGQSMALLLIDLDRFKEVNDSLGHDMGDLLLIETAKRIGDCVRESDTVARLGGDEFIVILSELDDPTNVERIAQNIINKLTASFKLGPEKAFISASIGISLYPNDTTRLDDLFKNADQAMYVAKNEGRNRFSYFTADLQEAANKRRSLTNDLRIALSGEQLRVYYQPIVELATGQIHKAEALIRWQHPERGLVSPVEFIALAEETGLIVPIGDWVFKEAVQQVKQWRSNYCESFQISVNKSPVQIRQDDRVHVAWPEYLKQHQMPGQSINIEITEGVLMNAESRINKKLLRFRDAGIQVSVDDFGTGYSSLAYLKEFDIDYLKIDRSFVHNLGPDSNDLALCEAIIVMAHKLGLKVIAEGVETAMQRDLLQTAGCDYAQGYLYSKPVPPAEFEKLLKPRLQEAPV